jgi:hypothetical protein
MRGLSGPPATALAAAASPTENDARDASTLEDVEKKERVG